MDKLLIISIISFIITILINYIVGSKVGKVAMITENEFRIRPDNWAFAIWGIIYFLLAISLGIGFKKQNNKLSTKWNILFILSCLFNSAWILTWTSGSTYAVEASITWLLGLSISLILLWYNSFEHEFISNVISVYSGWCFGATFLNLGISLIKNKILSPSITSIICTILLCLVQIGWQLFFPKYNLERSRGLLFVGFWTSLAIISREFKNNIKFDYTYVPFIGTIIATILHIYKTIEY